MPRQIKKTVIKYETSSQLSANKQAQPIKQDLNSLKYERQRSRQKVFEGQKQQESKKQVTVDVNSRKARLEAMKRAREQREKEEAQTKQIGVNKMNDQKLQGADSFKIVVVNDKEQVLAKDEGQTNEKKVKLQQKQATNNQGNNNIQTQNRKAIKINQQTNANKSQQGSSQSQDEESAIRVLNKPVFLSKEDRSQHHQQQQQQKKREQQRKRKNLRYTTKLLLQQNIRKEQQENSQQQVDNTNDDQDETNLPDDSDQVNQQLEYELWKIRELKRIRRDREARQRRLMEKTEIDRRRTMNNEQILLENRLLGSDSTQQETQTKYAFMQKYYHVGAFYQDSSDPIFQRDYNLPTPLEMQDKSALPAILQKRKGNFGKKGQSKYTHLTGEDTTDTNPLTRPDESLLNSWKKKMAGYKN